MEDWIKSRRGDICIWGTGEKGRKLYYKLKLSSHRNITKFYDNCKDNIGTSLYGIEVVGPEDINGNEYIIIASGAWKEICEQLISYRLKPFEDFLPDFFLGEKIYYEKIFDFKQICMQKKIDYQKLFKGKKIAVFYGNCQTSILGDMISLVHSFCQEYKIVKLPIVSDWNNSDGKGRAVLHALYEDKAFLEAIDLFIYQTVSVNNKFSEILATDYWIAKLKEECKKCHILNLYFTGYFPQVKAINRELLAEIHQNGLFPMEDIYVNDMLQAGMSKEDIIREIVDPNSSIVEPTSILTTINDSLKKLQEREGEVDVKISDYVKKMYREKQLWYSFNHPCEELLIEYLYRILAYLGVKADTLSVTDVVRQCSTLKGQDYPVYPCVAKCIGLKNKEMMFYPNIAIYPNLLLDIESYYNLYIDMLYQMQSVSYEK